MRKFFIFHVWAPFTALAWFNHLFDNNSGDIKGLVSI